MTPELLAPAGNLECLETAFYFGADAVYVGLERFGMRAFADNFSTADLERGIAHAHTLNKRVYVALNTLIRQEELSLLDETLEVLRNLKPDAIIFSDPAVLMAVERLQIPVPLHLSTQSSVMNGAACVFWHTRGVRRIILARELTIDQITEIHREIPPDLELEAFVHGAMCVAISGRCLLSSVLTGRSGNLGRCAQPCRWHFELSEAGRDGPAFPIIEMEGGTYLLNAKDLMMIDHLAELQHAGVRSFKIEGRNKSIYYVASAVSAYRKAVDALRDSTSLDRNVLSDLRDELLASTSRKAGTGFYFGGRADQQDVKRTELPRRYTFVGKVIHTEPGGWAVVEQRNRFEVGDRLEVLSPHISGSFCLDRLLTLEGAQIAAAPHPQELLKLWSPLTLRAGDLLRRRDT